MLASDMNAMVGSLLRDLGSRAVWTSFAETMNPSTGLVARTALSQDVVGAFTAVAHSFAPDNAAGVRQRVFVMSASGLTGTPMPGDRLSADGTDFTVEEVETVSASGLALAHKLVLAR